MKTSTSLFVAIAAIAGVVVVAGAVSADSRSGWGGGSPMHRMHGHGGGFGQDMLMRRALELADADKDGKVTQEEIDAARDRLFVAHDRDQNGELDIEEFEGLFLEVTRPAMVRAFQFFAPDGNAVISADELGRPVARAIERFDRSGDGALSREDAPSHRWRSGMSEDKSEQ